MIRSAVATDGCSTRYRKQIAIAGLRIQDTEHRRELGYRGRLRNRLPALLSVCDELAAEFWTVLRIVPSDCNDELAMLILVVTLVIVSV